jgi:uncharacterized protein (DUF1330 family)
MSAYVIVDITILDHVGYQEYKNLAESTVVAYGGRYIARGGHSETLEGEWAPNRLVLLEFDSLERAKQWLNSPEYNGPKQLRHKTARTNMVVVEGL